MYLSRFSVIPLVFSEVSDINCLRVIPSFQMVLGLPLILQFVGTHCKTFFGSLVSFILCTCPYHTSCFLSLSIDAEPIATLMLSVLVLCIVSLNMFISTPFSFLLFFSVTLHVSAPYSRFLFIWFYKSLFPFLIRFLVPQNAIKGAYCLSFPLMQKYSYKYDEESWGYTTLAKPLLIHL